MRDGSHVKSRITRCAAPLIAALLAFSCATPLRYEEPRDPLELLSPGALLYLRLDGPAIREFAPALLGEKAAGKLRPLMERSRAAGLALLPGPRGFEAALMGDYPFDWANWSLSRDKAWKPEGRGYRNEAEGLSAAVPGPGLILASSGPVEPLVARLESGGPGAAKGASHAGGAILPPELDGIQAANVLAWAPEPFSRILSPLLGDQVEVPARGLAVAARRGEKAANYDVTLVFLMKDAESARIFRPAIRLGWFALSGSLLPGNEAARKLRFEAAGPCIRSESLSLEPGEFAAVAAALGKAAGGARP
jgi:hypothetical protein